MKNVGVFHMERIRFYRVAVARLVIPFGVGLVVGYFRDFSVEVLVAVGVGLAVVFWIGYRKKWGVAALAAAWVVLGMAWYEVRERPPDFLPEWRWWRGDWVVQVKGVAHRSAEVVIYRAEVWGWRPEGGRWQWGGERVLIRQAGGKGLPLGVLVLKGSLSPIDKSSPPFFINWNRRRWGRFRYMIHPEAWQVVSASEEEVWERWRRRLAASLRRVLAEENYPVAKAMLLGMREGLSPEVREYFSRAGSVHVLAISGLHVGIIYLPLVMLTRWWRHRRRGRWIRLGVLVVGLGGYALLTGLHPSVVRAVVMFLFFGLAVSWEKDQWLINVAMMSMFVLLVVWPGFLFQAGFQLSYAAVFGILGVVGAVRRRLWIRNRVIRWAVMLLAVSAAAQAATLPLVLYYFGRVPVYSVLASLVVIPLASVIVYVGVLFLVMDVVWPGGWGAVALGKLLDAAVGGLVKFSAMVSGLPGAVWEGIYVHDWEWGILAMVVVMGVLALHARKGKVLWWGAAVMLLVYAVVRTVRKVRVICSVHYAWVDARQGSAWVAIKGDSARVVLFGASPDDFLRRQERLLGYFFVRHVVFDTVWRSEPAWGWIRRGPLVMVGRRLVQVDEGGRTVWVAPYVMHLRRKKWYVRSTMGPPPWGFGWKPLKLKRRKVIWL